MRTIKQAAVQPLIGIIDRHAHHVRANIAEHFAIGTHTAHLQAVNIVNGPDRGTLAANVDLAGCEGPDIDKVLCIKIRLDHWVGSEQFICCAHTNPGIGVVQRKIRDAVTCEFLWKVDRNDRPHVGHAIMDRLHRCICLKQCATPLNIDLHIAFRPLGNLVGKPLNCIGARTTVRPCLAKYQDSFCSDSATRE